MSVPADDPRATEVNANDVVAFLVEIAALTLIGSAGWQAGGSTPTRVLVAVGVVLVAVVLWGLFAAPRAPFGSPALRLATQVVVLGAGVVAGFVVLPSVWATVVAVVVAVSSVLMYVGPFAHHDEAGPLS